MKAESYEMPALLYFEGLLNEALPSKKHLLYNKFFVFATEYIHRSLFCEESDPSSFSFTRLMNLSPMELNKIFVAGILFR